MSYQLGTLEKAILVTREKDLFRRGNLQCFFHDLGQHLSITLQDTAKADISDAAAKILLKNRLYGIYGSTKCGKLYAT